MQASIGRAFGRTFGFLCGFGLVLSGYALLTPDVGLGQGDRPIVGVLVALGIGVTAAALLPNTLTLSGEKVRPLGLNVSATGGAAFFIVTLIFLFYTFDKATTGETVPVDSPAPFEETARNEAAPPIPAPTASPAANWETGSPEPPTVDKQPVMPPPTPVQNVQQFAPVQQAAPILQAAMFEVGTYCSACCPQGPENCAQVGFGQAATLEQALLTAVTMCVANGGREDTCLANAEQY